MDHQTELLTLKLLQFKDESRNSSLTDYMLENAGDDVSCIKNVCAKLHIDLVNRLDHSLAVLGISKRLFIETAIINALEEFDRLATELDVDEYSRYTQEAMKQESSK